MSRLIKQTLQEYAPLAQDHELRLFVNEQLVSFEEQSQEDGAQPQLKVQADAERLEQVVVNLLSNAVKYSPEHGPVTVSVRDLRDGSIEIAVEDKGIGIPPDEQKQLTERFYRARNAQSVDAKGLGLGLYLVDTLVAKHGGSLTIASEGIPGKGSTFTIKLPSQEQKR